VERPLIRLWVMANELVLSCYLVRMRQTHNAIQIEVQDVRSGRIEHFQRIKLSLI
jgi:hypothetical protein